MIVFVLKQKRLCIQYALLGLTQKVLIRPRLNLNGPTQQPTHHIHNSPDLKQKRIIKIGTPRKSYKVVYI